jgi:hypothetical protein
MSYQDISARNITSYETEYLFSLTHQWSCSNRDCSRLWNLFYVWRLSFQLFFKALIVHWVPWYIIYSWAIMDWTALPFTNSKLILKVWIPIHCLRAWPTRMQYRKLPLANSNMHFSCLGIQTRLHLRSYHYGTVTMGEAQHRYLKSSRTIKQTPWLSVHKRTIPTERLPPVDKF